MDKNEFFASLKLIALSQNGIEPTVEALNQNQGWPVPMIPIIHDWTLTPIEIQSYEQFFQETDTDNDGFIDSQQGKPLLTQSGLPNDDLIKIWDLSDVDQDSKLNKQEYVIALQLVAKRKQGYNLPDTLPEPLMLYRNSQHTVKKILHFFFFYAFFQILFAQKKNIYLFHFQIISSNPSKKQNSYFNFFFSTKKKYIN